MSEGDQAAGITQMAAQAADALTKVAAAEALAVVAVAAAAHENLAPSVIVVSMFETLQRQIEAVGKDLTDGRRWMADATGAYQKLADGQDELRAVVKVQNGGVTRALDWMRAHDDRLKAEADVALGEQRVKDQARGRVAAIWRRIEKPVVYGVGLTLIGFGLRLGAFFIGGPW